VGTAFTIPLWADLLAVGIGSLQGALFAAGFRDRRLDLLGVAIIGIATGFGGGILRDLLLAQTPAALRSDWYLPVATGAALLGMAAERLFHRLRVPLAALDAVTLGLFGAIGTTKALSLGLPVIPSIFLGSISAVGGSILRDLLLGLPIALMQVGSLYAVAAVLGSASLIVLVAVGAPILVAAVVCVVITVATRILAVLFHWTLPEQRAIAWRFTWRRRPRA
jgi:uncharacterized membrane protein YeiH